MRRHIDSWTTTLTRLGFRRKQRKVKSTWHYSRRPLFESLEMRAMLTVQGPVDTLWDVVNANDGVYSLREAITDANLDATADVITFDPELTGTITLNATQLPTISQALTIAGPGADMLTINGNLQSRVIEIATGINVTLQNLTVTGGKATGTIHGGGIRSWGNLTLDHVNLVGNQAINSARGAGLFAWGNTVIVDSTFDGNTGIHGGGAYMGVGSGQSIEITGSTFSNNIVSGSGAGLLLEGATGVTDTVLIKNSTFSGNTAGTYSGGIRAQTNVNVTIINSTITKNTGTTNEGGVSSQAGASVLVHNSILLENTSGTSANLSDAAGTFDGLSSYNLVGQTNVAALNDTADHNIAYNPAIPLLAPLGNYDGPTKTHALLLGSQAIDAGSSTVAGAPLNDQRGNERGNDAGWDIGAVELQQVAALDGFSEFTGTAGNDDIRVTGSYILLAGGHGAQVLGTIGTESRVKIWGLQGNDTITVFDGAANVRFELHGGTGNDIIRGGAINDAIYGDDGQDQLYGRGGGDFLFGGWGDDILEGGAGDDSMLGENGNDTYRFAGSEVLGTDWIFEGVGQGNDTLDFLGMTSRVDISLDSFPEQQVAAGKLWLFGLFSEELENVIGTVFNDTIIGNDLSNRLEGRAGDDTLIGGAGNDTYVYAGPSQLGIDTIGEGFGYGIDGLDFAGLSFGAGISLDLMSTDSTHQIININGNSVALNLSEYPEIENVIGTSFADTIYGNDFDNYLNGLNGNDALYGNWGNDELAGGGNNDLLEGLGGDDVLIGGGGDDTYRFASGGVMGTDSIFDSLGGGTDTLDFSGMPARVDIDLEDGTIQEVVTGKLFLSGLLSEEIEKVVGTAYSDTIRGNNVNNHLYGGEGYDVLYGDSISDVLEGGAGDDAYAFFGMLSSEPSLLALNVVEEIDNGYDILSFFDLEHAAYVNLNRFPSIEEVYGSDYDDIFIVSSGAYLVKGYSGNDQYRFKGNEEPNLDAVGEDADAGTDTLDFSGMYHGVDVDLSSYPLTEIENVFGSNFDDTITGNASANLLQGNRGDDAYRFVDSHPVAVDAVIEALNEGLDTVDFSGLTSGVTFDMRGTANVENAKGTSFADSITGNARDNHIVTGEGNDWLQGREGIDRLEGGADMDTYSLLTGETLNATDIVVDPDPYLVVQAGGTPHAAPTIQLSGNTNSSGQYATLPDNTIILGTIADLDTSIGNLSIQVTGLDASDVSVSPAGVITWTPDLMEEASLGNVMITVTDAEGLSQIKSIKSYVIVGTDSDADGMSNAREQQLGTNSLNRDTDGDKLSDIYEVKYGLDFLDKDQNDNNTDDFEEDFDDDGLVNLEENGYGTNPESPNTDGDSVSDSDEIDQGSDPLDPSDNTPADDDDVTWFAGALQFDEFTLTVGNQKIIGGTDYYNGSLYFPNWFDVPLQRGRSHNVELEGDGWEAAYPVYLGSVPSSYPIYFWAEGGDPVFVEDPDIPEGAPYYGSAFYGEATLWLPKGNMTAYRPMQTTGGYGPFEKTEVPEEEAVGIRINNDDDNGNGNKDRFESNSVSKENDLIEVVIEALPGDYDHFRLESEDNNLLIWTSPTKGQQIIFEEGTDRTETLDVGSDGKLTVYVEWVGPNHGTEELRLVDTFGHVFDTLTFNTLESLVIGFSGEQFSESLGSMNPLDSGMFDMAEKLYEDGWDVQYYNEDAVDYATVLNPVFKDVVSAVQERLVSSLALFGHSHGGGATYLFTSMITAYFEPFAAQPTIALTAYVDAVEQDFLEPETRVPENTQRHVNYYQRYISPFRGDTIPNAAVDRNVNDLDWNDPITGNDLKHGTIDDSADVHGHLFVQFRDFVPQ